MMKPSYVLKLALSAVIGVMATGPAQAAPERPNILVIMCDDLGYADVGFNGSPDITTPELDKLASAGTVCTSAYAAHPFCGPSRMGFVTGRFPYNIGTPYNLPESADGVSDLGVPESEPLIGTVLQDAGYFTGILGKWHLGATAAYHPNKRGFDEFYGFLAGGHSYFPEDFQAKYAQQVKAGNKKIWDYLVPLERNGEEVEETEYVTDGLSREAVSFIGKAKAKDEPFFLFLSYNAPHTPLEATEEDMAMFPDIKDSKRRTYAGMVYAVDRGVGKLVEALKANGQFENTLIVFMSDNGGRLDSGANNGPLREGKGSAQEGGFRVPMFFHWPGVVPAGARYPYPVTALDCYPTFVGLAGASLPEGKVLDGRDIMPALLADADGRKGEMIYTIVHRNGYSDFGARVDDYKVVWTRNQKWALYDVQNDPAESKDLSAKHPERVQSMVAQLASLTKDQPQPLFFHAAETEKKWKEAGMPNYEKAFAN